MLKNFTMIIFIFAIILSPLLISSTVHATPPRPGPNFVWVAPHIAPSGVHVPGHWKYVGPPKPGQAWIPGFYAPNGAWAPGHWKPVGLPRPGAVWTAGHYGPKGRWIPGHWR